MGHTQTLLGILVGSSLLSSYVGAKSLLNVSYDPTREFFIDVNKSFSLEWQAQTGEKVEIQQSHGGSGKQARAVIDGLGADVVSLALAYDIDAIANKGMIEAKWEDKFPHKSSPFLSTIVFLVRKGNPRAIKDWNDLIKPGVGIVTPNPKTSGGARWNYLAAWGYARRHLSGSDAGAQNFVKALYRNVKVLDTGARGATTTFAKRGIGDVLITWENEAFLALKELGKSDFELVVPSRSILAEPVVSIVDKNVAKHETKALAQAYIQFLYSPKGQELVAKHGYRPRSPEVLKKYEAKFQKLELFTIEEFGGWQEAHKVHFQDGGTFDRIYGLNG